MDSHERQLICAHIEAMNAQTKAISLLTKAMSEQVDVISQLVNAVALLIDTDEAEQDSGQEPYRLLMNGKPY